jgi:membrane fusion protein (multidrug efflux system)
MRFSKGTLSVITVALVVSLLAWGIYMRLRPEDGGEEALAADTSSVGLSDLSASEQFATDVPQPVSGAVVRRDTLWLSVTAEGQAEAFRKTAIAALVGGTVQRVAVRENSPVSSGSTLLQIDTTEHALAVSRARADYLQAEAAFRELVLFDNEIQDPQLRAERERLARSRSGLQQAEVSLREAELNLARTQVAAPFGGRVADLEVVTGQYVTQGTELLTVVDLDPIKIEVQVLQGDLVHLLEGRRASMVFSALPDETFVGRVETINPIVDPETGAARVTVHLPNPDGRIKPGMFARVSLDLQSFPDRILVPRAAVLERDRRTMLFVYEGDQSQGVAMWRYVTTGLENDSLVEIVSHEETSMVEPGEVVLVGGHAYLAHQVPVRLIEPAGG